MDNWHSEDVEAEILYTRGPHRDYAVHRGKICVIKTVSWGPCWVWIVSDDETIYVEREDLKPVKPRKNHKVALKTL